MLTQIKDAKGLVTSSHFENEIGKVLPQSMPKEKFNRIALNTIMRFPNINNCEPKSVANCFLTLAQYELYPDGHHAYIVPYGKDAQLIISYKGLLAIARRNGVIAEAKSVHENDHFEVEEDDGTGRTKISHKVDYTKPRGKLMCVYSRSSWGVGDERETSYEVMTLDEVESIKNRSKASGSGPWKTDFNEMAKKTVIRRHSKRWPMDAETVQVLDQDYDRPADISEPKTVAPIFDTLPNDSHSELEAQPTQKLPTWVRNVNKLKSMQDAQVQVFEDDPAIEALHAAGMTPAAAAKKIVAEGIGKPTQIAPAEDHKILGETKVHKLIADLGISEQDLLGFLKRQNFIGEARAIDYLDGSQIDEIADLLTQKGEWVKGQLNA